MAIELAEAYVTVKPDTKDIESGIRKAVTAADRNLTIRPTVDTRHITSSMSGVGRDIGSQVSKGLKSGLDEAVRGMSSQFGPLSGVAEKALGSITSGAGVASLALGGVGLAAVGIGTELYKLGSMWDSIADGIAGKTGLIGDQLKGITDSVKNVGLQSSASLTDIGNAAGSLYQSLRLTGKPLEDLTKRITDLQELTGDKLNIRDLAKVFKGFNIEAKDMPTALDKLYDTFTNTGIPVSELIATLKDVGPTARTMGLDIADTAGLLATLEEAGLNGETAFNGLKIAMGNLAKKEPGQDPQQAIQDVIGEIGNLVAAGDEVAAIDLAKSTFGKSWQQIFDAIANGKLAAEDVNDAFVDTGHSIEETKNNTDDAGEAFKNLKNTLQVELEPAATSVFNQINDAVRQTTQTIREEIQNWKNAFAAVRDFWNTTIGQGGPMGPATLGPNGQPVPTAQPPAGANPLNAFAPTQPGGVPAATPSTQGPLGNLIGGAAQTGAGFTVGPYRPGGGTAMPGGAQSARAYAHTTAMPFWQNQGYTVGDHAADQYGEHQNGALDVMVPGIAQGQQVLQQALSDPNVYGVIFNGQSYGYGQGMTPQPYTGPNPHTDHVHIWYKPQGFDEGGWLPPGAQWVLNATGQPELVLNQDQAQQVASAVNPDTTTHGQAQGAPPGPIDPQQLADMAAAQQQQGAQTPSTTQLPTTEEAGRFAGYIPAAVASGNLGVPGTSAAAGFLNLGNQAVQGLIDTGASIGKTAINAGISAGLGAANMAAPGVSAAAPAIGGLANFGIDLAANIGKRASAYGFQLLSIGFDSMVENMFPFGTPRWLGYDYTGFMPQLSLQKIGVTTGEKAALQAPKQPSGAPPMPPGTEHMPPGAAPGVPIPPGPTTQAPGMQPGGPVTPETMPGAETKQPTAAPTRITGIPTAPMIPAPTGPPPGPGAPVPGSQPGVPGGPQAADPGAMFEQGMQPAINQLTDPNTWLNIFGFDEGGYLAPGQVGVNMTQKPEPVFNSEQWQSMQSMLDAPPGDPSRQGNFGVNINNLYAVDANDVKRQIDAQQKLAMMRYTGRPW